jgi:hypothetical protein
MGNDRRGRHALGHREFQQQRIALAVEQRDSGPHQQRLPHRFGEQYRVRECQRIRIQLRFIVIKPIAVRRA